MNGVMMELDCIRCEQRHSTGKLRLHTKRVNISHLNVKPPTMFIYPFMVNHSWYEAHIEGTEWAYDLVFYNEPLAGFDEDNENDKPDGSAPGPPLSPTWEPSESSSEIPFSSHVDGNEDSEDKPSAASSGLEYCDWYC